MVRKKKVKIFEQKEKPINSIKKSEKKNTDFFFFFKFFSAFCCCCWIQTLIRMYHKPIIDSKTEPQKNTSYFPFKRCVFFFFLFFFVQFSLLFDIPQAKAIISYFISFTYILKMRNHFRAT